MTQKEFIEISNLCVLALYKSMFDFAIKNGISLNVAEIMIVNTIWGAANLLIDFDSPSELIKQVASSGGTTEAALKLLMDEKNGMGKLIGEVFGVK